MKHLQELRDITVALRAAQAVRHETAPKIREEEAAGDGNAFRSDEEIELVSEIETILRLEHQHYATLLFHVLGQTEPRPKEPTRKQMFAVVAGQERGSECHCKKCIAERETDLGAGSFLARASGLVPGPLVAGSAPNPTSQSPIEALRDAIPPPNDTVTPAAKEKMN